MTAILTTDWNTQLLTVGGSPYHLGLGADASLVQHAHFAWDASLAATITIWTCGFPPTRVALNDATAGRWVQQQPSTGYSAVSPAGAATVGASPFILTIAGGTAGGWDVEIGNLGAPRVKAIVTVTGQGQLWWIANGKE